MPFLISKMFKTESQKNTFLEQTKAAREGRAFEKKKEVAVTKLQAAVRGWLQRIHFRRDVLYEYYLLININQKFFISFYKSSGVIHSD